MSRRIDYEASWLISEVPGRRHIIDALRAIKKERDVRGQRVIELGSGIGTNLAVFAEDNLVLGLEGLEAAATESRRRGIEALVVDVEGEIPLESGCADWLLCIDVLEHLFAPAKCLESARRILKEHGHLIVGVPNHFDLYGRLRVLGGSGIDSQRYFPDSPHWQYPHVRFFSRQSIEGLLQHAGFAVVSDYASRFVSVPKQHLWESMGMRGVLRAVQSRWPNLLSRGFFLLCRKC